ncbi:MAG: VanW family protein [Agathobacter sp.]|nr:VanW family protein [Agathobacter sp.]
MKKIKVFAVALLLVAGTFLFTNEHIFKADVSADAKIEQGVYIGGVDVSGMTAEEATNAVNAYVENVKAQTITLVGPKANLELTLGEGMGLTAKTEAAVQEAVAVGRAGNLISRFKTLQDLEKENYVIDMGFAIDKQLVGETLYNKAGKINVESIDNGLKIENGQFVFVPGQAGDEVDIVTAVNELNAHISTDWELAVVENEEFKLNSIVSQPRGTEEELSVVKDLLGSFSTNYRSSGAGRAKNVENGASKINGTILYPGDELSVYELVNPFTKENGYELAGSYLNGETVESFGGGICQVSTTLYNAALKAELEITQRYNHSMIVTYVDPSADAAIAGTYKDLRFKNQYDFPVYIEGTWSNRNITFNIYGVETRAANRTVAYVSETINVNDPLTEFTLDPAQPLGVFAQTRAEHIGYTAKLWKVVKVDGVEQERTEVNKSTYQASCRKVTIGIAGATAEQMNAINWAISTGDDATVQATIAALIAPPAPEPVPTPEPTPTPEPDETPDETPDEEEPSDEEGTPDEETGEDETE